MNAELAHCEKQTADLAKRVKACECPWLSNISKFSACSTPSAVCCGLGAGVHGCGDEGNRGCKGRWSRSPYGSEAGTKVHNSISPPPTGSGGGPELGWKMGIDRTADCVVRLRRRDEMRVRELNGWKANGGRIGTKNFLTAPRADLVSPGLNE